MSVQLSLNSSEKDEALIKAKLTDIDRFQSTKSKQT